MRFTIHQASRIGRRSSNQDRLAFSYSSEALLMVVADGMGGHAHGETAAQVAVERIVAAFEREAMPRLPDPFLFLSWSFDDAHVAIAAHADAHGMAETPRTTCVACIVQDNIAYWAHAGDSRLYVVRDGRVLAHTRDHSRVQLLVDRGVLTPEEAQRHPGRNLIYSCLGGEQPPQVDFSHKTPLLAGDALMLCSDGVWGPLDEAAIAAALSGDDMREAAEQLLDEAEASAGETCDNLSLVAMSWLESYGDAETTQVETRTLPLGVHTTVMGAGMPAADEELTEEDIDRAIEQIRGAIRKYSS